VPPEAFTQERPVCAYCGVVLDTMSKRAAQLASVRPSSTLAPILVGVALVSGAAVIGLVLHKPAPPTVPAKAVTATPTPSPAPAAPAARGGGTSIPDGVPTGPPGVFWVDQYAHVVAVDVNGDGTDDLIGGFARREGANVNAYVGAFDGKTLALLWSDGPLSTREKATRKTKVAYASGRVVATSARGEAMLYDAGTGARLGTFPSVDELNDPCGPPPGDKRVFIKTKGKSGLLVDVDAAVAKPGTAPEWCVERRHHLADSGDVWERQAHVIAGGFLEPPPDHVADALPKVPRLEITTAMSDGDDGAVVGALRGEDGAVFVGFDPKTKQVRWQTAAKALIGEGTTKFHRTSPMVDMAFGRLYFDYELRGERRLFAIDAKTGEKAFDAAVPGDGELDNPTYTKDRIYVVLWKGGDGTSVVVLDARTGALVGWLGAR
jgi:outer membrane protein assembly factor BamB